ncbi:MAG: peptidoglycan DD-metalloendopeptidase family protein [Myxococcota bacterium]
MNRGLATLGAILSLSAASADAQFEWRPPGELERAEGAAPQPGLGREDDRVYAPDMRFPMEESPAFANSQIYGRGGGFGPGGGQCDAANYSFPWFDNYCEARRWDMPLCPTGNGHQGQDIRPATCADDTHWIVAAADGVITNDQRDGGFATYLMADDGTRYDYLHMTSTVVRVGQRVSRGERLGRCSNEFGGTPTTIHLHFNIQQNVDGVGTVFAPTYMSLVRSYEALTGEGADYRATFVSQTFPLSSQDFPVIAGELVTGTFEFRNDGAATWRPGEVFMAPTEPRGGPSPMRAPDWISDGRIVTVAAETAPGEVGTFNVTLAAPSGAGEYRQFFNFVTSDGTWFSDSGGPPDDVVEVRMMVSPCADGDWVCSGSSRVRCIGGTAERELCEGACTDGRCSGSLVDNDDDGFTVDVDCDDSKAAVFPGAREFCDDGIDQDCSGVDATCAPGVDAGVDGGVEPPGGGGGCGCRVGASATPSAPAFAVGLLALVLWRRRHA